MVIKDFDITFKVVKTDKKNKETYCVSYFYTFVGSKIPTIPTIKVKSCTNATMHMVRDTHFPSPLLFLSPSHIFFTYTNSLQLGYIHHWLITRLDILLFDWKHGGNH